ncbi:hypothetical protein ACFL6S_02375, partial [Candidatus Poribacteria bacterium]
MDYEQLCIALAHCETEDDVIRLLQRQGYWDEPMAWRNYGDNENNFATVGNQQSLPESAIVEKIINSVDAVLMAECLRRGTNPESTAAPQSIREALFEYFHIYDGKLSNISSTERGKLAENICLVATGTKTNPCYSIIDKGEGQTPEGMPETLLSIGKSNKLRIPFVQGKFNMGGTGVFQFCGKHNLQLVISKRHPDIAKSEHDPSRSKWGFTVVRREDPGSGVRSSTYRYLALGGHILSFESNGLPLLPGEYPEAYGMELKWGTFIKLYEYQMTGLKTTLTLDPYYRLSLLIPSIALPVRLYERREGYKAHSMENILSGLTVRLDEDPRENLEPDFADPPSIALQVQDQSMKASIFVFKKGRSVNYKKSEGVIFTVNGQTRAHLQQSFFSRQSVGMGYLAESLLVIIDCSDLDGRAREDLFMNSRDRLRSGDLRSHIESNLEDLLKNHQGLRELRAQRRSEEIENRLGDSRPLVDVIEDVFKKSPTLSKLFIDGTRIPNPFKLEKAKVDENYKGKKFPTYFTLIDGFPIDSPKKCHINQRFRVQYKTDSTNDYFDRDNSPGILSLKLNNDQILEYSMNLWNGFATLNVSPTSGSKIGDLLHFESQINDVSRAEAFEDEFFVEIDRPVERRPSEAGKRRKSSSDRNGKNGEKRSDLALPEVIEVRQEDWEDHSFNDESGMEAKDNGEGSCDFFVNMDNRYILAEQKTNTKIDSRGYVRQYKSAPDDVRKRYHF